VGGTHPLRLTVDTPSGAREFQSNEVAQVHLSPLNNATATATTGTATALPAAIPAGAINVPANVGWTNTGIPVLRGQRIQFNAHGDVMISPTASSGPGGSPAVTYPTSRYPLQGAPAGALIGRVGNGAPFLIGTNTQPIAMPATGPLMLGINDDVLNDNSGSYSVSISNADSG